MAKIKDVIFEYSVRNKANENINVYSVTNEKGFCTDYFSKEVASKDKTAYKIVPRGYFAYNPSRINVGSIDWQNHEDRVIVSPLYVVFGVSKHIDQQYLLYYLKSDIMLSLIKESATGSVRDNLKLSTLEEFPINLRPIDEQRHIAAVLDKVSDLIAKRRQQLDKLDEMVKAKFVEMFGEPGEDKNNWGINCLGDVCEINPKKSLDKRLVNDFIVSFIPMPAVTENGEIDPSESKTYDEVRTGFTYFVENDVLFAKITPCMENGKGAIAKGLYNGVGFGSTEFHVLRPIKDKTTAPWLYALTSLPKFRLDAADNMTGSAGQRRVPASFLTTYKVAAPPIELQEQFSTLYNQISKSKLTIQRSCDKLEVLKKALMQRYFG